MTQGQLFAEPLTSDEQAAAFDAANPHILAAIVRMARERKARGETQWSVRAAFEVLRYKHDLETTGTETPVGRVKLCNAYSPFFARKIRADYPDIASMFVLGPRRQ